VGLITGLLTLPLAPVRGVVWVADQLQREAERQWSDPAATRRALAELDVMVASGLIDSQEAERREEALVQRLLGTAGGDTGGWVIDEEARRG
jgi:hypothetical protein